MDGLFGYQQTYCDKLGLIVSIANGPPKAVNFLAGLRFRRCAKIKDRPIGEEMVSRLTAVTRLRSQLM